MKTIDLGNHIRKAIAAFCIIAVPNILLSQNAADIESLCKNENILIVKEKVDYTFMGVKFDFLHLITKKEIEYKILNQAGANELKTFVLPQPIDETFFVHTTDIRNFSVLSDNTTLTSFSGQVIKSDGQIIDIPNTPDLVNLRTIADNGYFGAIKTFHFAIPDLKVGDRVKIKYELQNPFRNNIYSMMVSRFFFHDKYPVADLDLSFSYDKTLQADTNFNHCSTELKIIGDHYCFNWHYRNLPGCLDEEGSHPYMDLPWFTFHPKLNESLEYAFDSFKEEFVKPWYLMTGHSMESYRNYLMEAQQGVKNEDNLGFEKLAKKFNNLKHDIADDMRLWNFQKWIADSTVYHPDTSYYLRNEMQIISRPGADLSHGFVRDHNKDDVYAAMIPRLGYLFVNAYLMDKRVGNISDTYYPSMHDNDVVYGVPLSNNIISYVIPVSDRNHYYFEELPFYYEDVPVIIMHPNDFKGYKRNYYDSLRIVRTQGSAFSENIRNSSCMVQVNVAEKDLAFNAKVNLSGQYSTLSRSVYLKKLPDKSINPEYLKKFWKIGGLVKDAQSSVVSGNYIFPYKATITGQYHSNSIKKTGENTYEIDIANWFRHVIYPNLKTTNRTLDFYPDFLGSDKYFYMLSFDKNIELIDTVEKINLENKLGSYTFNLAQTDKNKLLITSYFICNSLKIPVAEIRDVEDIYNAIKSRKEFKIRFRTTD